MSLEPELLELMAQTVTFKVMGAKDMYGDRSTASTFTSPCRIEGGVQRQYLDQMRINNAEGLLYVPDSPIISVDYRVVLPGGTEKRIVQVVAEYDERGLHHQVVMYA